MIRLVTAVPGSPLDPSPDRADELLRRELLRPEYHDQNLMQRFLDWIGDKLSSGLDSASQAPPLGIVGACIVFGLLLLAIGWLVTRARRDPRTASTTGAVLTDETITAAQLRQRAEAALAAGDVGPALVDGFRALAVRQIERGRLADQPGATAHEVAGSLGSTYADQRPAVDDAAALFDLVLYGHRPVTADQARGVLALDDVLAGRR